jgi:riboflavin transporter FmnP
MVGTDVVGTDVVVRRSRPQRLIGSDLMNRVMRAPFSGATKVASLGCILASWSCAFLMTHVSDKGSRPSGIAAVVLLTLAFFVAEVLPIHVNAGADRHTISFNELPLAIGLILLGPAALVASTLIGNGVAFVLHRRQRGVKLGFNLALGAFQTVVAVVVFSVVGDGALRSPSTCIALVLAMVAADTVAALLVALAITLFRGTPEGVWTTRVFVGGATESLAKSLLGLLGVLALIEGGNIVVAAVAASSALAYLAYRAYAGGRSGRIVVAPTS